MPEITLYFSPRACSLACHVALEESGIEFAAQRVRIRKDEHKRPDYLAVNPWGKVPTLVFDGQALTETHAILTLVADLAPADRALLPRGDGLERARAHEWMSFLSSTVHPAFRPFFRPYLMLDEPSMYPRLRETGLPTYRKVLLEVDRRLAGRQWALGDCYSVCDAYLLVFHIWCQREDMVGYAPDLPNWAAHRARIDARPATQRAYAREGLSAANIRDP